MGRKRDCKHCIHKIPVLKNDGTWTAECEVWDCEFISREECFNAFRNAEPVRGEKNYIDKNGNYINVENLPLNEIFNQGKVEGYKKGFIQGSMSKSESGDILKGGAE